MYKLTVFSKSDNRGFLELSTMDEVNNKIQEWTQSQHWGLNPRFVNEDNHALIGLDLNTLETQEIEVQMSPMEIEALTEEEKESYKVIPSEGEPYYDFKKTITQYLAPATWSCTIEDITAQYNQEQLNKTSRQFLNDTDWKVLRHIGQKALGVTTSMTEAEYEALEEARQEARDSIIE